MFKVAMLQKERTNDAHWSYIYWNSHGKNDK